MNFDLSWFATVPGLFITGGVILLIIALVILLITGKKAKQEKANANGGGVETPGTQGIQPAMNVPGSVPLGVAPTVPTAPVGSVTSAQPMVTPVDPMAVAQATVPTGQEGLAQPVAAEPFQSMPVSPEPGVDNSMIATPQTTAGLDMNTQPPIMDSTSIAMPDAVPTVPESVVADSNMMVQPNTMSEPVNVNQNMEQAVAMPEVMQTVSDVAPTFPGVDVQPVVSEPVPNAVSEVAPIVAPEVASIEQPMTAPEQPIVDSVPIVNDNLANTNGVQAVEPVIYGGASPIVSDININQEADHQIYGGADPLQNTQSIPNVGPVAAPVEAQNVEPVMVAQVAPQTEPVQNVTPVAMPEVATVSTVQQ